MEYVQELEESGFSERQAKASVNLWLKLMNEDLATKTDMKEQQFVFKADLQAVRTELKAEIQQLRTELQEVRAELKAEIQEVRSEIKEIRHDIHQVESRLTIKLGGMLALGLSLMALINKF